MNRCSMRFLAKLTVSFFTVVLFNASACADGLMRSLPEEGCWATYRMSEQWDNGTERQIDVTLKSLGREDTGGTPSSWLEVVFETPDRNTRLAFRFLTPDQYLVTGADPLGQAVRVWVRKDDAEPRLDASWSGFLPRLALAVPAQIKNQTWSDDQESVLHGGKKLDCDVVTGTLNMEFPKTKTITKYRLLSNAAVPFGVAAASVEATAVGNCDPDPNAECNFVNGTVRFTLTSMGRNATSVVYLPDGSDDEPSDARETSASSFLKSESTSRSP